MIKDIEVSYLGVKTRVSHSLYKPLKGGSPCIHYCFHMPNKKNVVIEQLADQHEKRYWAEVSKGRTQLASELGQLLENHEVDADQAFDTNILEDIEINYNGNKVRVSHSMRQRENTDTGNIVYTWYLRSGPVTIRQYKENDDCYWKEIPGGNTSLADELGAALEKYYLDDF